MSGLRFLVQVVGSVICALLVVVGVWTLGIEMWSAKSTFLAIFGLLVCLADFMLAATLLYMGFAWLTENVGKVSFPAVLLPLALSAFLLTGSGCGYTRVPPGYVGVKVNLWGSDKGVANATAVTGIQVYNPFKTEIHLFPIFLQQQVFTKDDTPESPGDESITFNSKQSSLVNADVFLAYSLEPEKIPQLFVKFRQDIGRITHTYMRSQIRDIVAHYGQTMDTMLILGEGRRELEANVLKELQTRMAPDGIKVESFAFVSGLRVDDKVMQAVNQAIAATQAAIQAENMVRAKQAEGDQAKALAQGQADAQLIRAKAEAQANEILAKSITPTLVEWERIRKWDGKLSLVSGPAMPMVDLKQAQ
jgi:regulator of protease activity HflC (stomatin/prohibitin superfamily)